MTTARVIVSGKTVNVEYIGFDNDGYSIYKEPATGREYHEVELDFSYPTQYPNVNIHIHY